MKKILAWVLVLMMVVGMFAGCQNTDAPTTPSDPVAESNLASAMEYLEQMYKEVGEKTPKDFTRPASVPYGTERYAITWTTNNDEIKIVDNGDGTVTVDVNEAATADVYYDLTATMVDANGQTATYTWKHLMPAAPAAGDQTGIVNDAYALENGASMGYEVTLTGKIIAVNTPYAADYKNVTVTIAVPGAEDKPIMCYRLKGDGADLIDNGWTITVTGTIKNYNGTIEFDAGCILDSYVEGEGVKQPEDPTQVVAEGYALADGATLPYTATLTGVISVIDTPYSADYGNITVTIKVAGAEDKPITCYRMKGTGVEDLYIGDTITVKGLIKNYKGTIEFDTGCQLLSVVPGERLTAPEDPYEILDAAYALKRDEDLPYEVILSGIVTTVDEPYSEEYNNITVTITLVGAKDQPITCFRMKGDGITKIKPSDTITVKGYITNYEGKREFKSGCKLVEIVEKGPGYHAPETQEEIVEHIKTLPITCTLLYKAKLTGEIVKVNQAYSSKYGNITVTIGLKDASGADYNLKIYRLKGKDIDQIKKGDTITVEGYITNYVHNWEDPVKNSEVEMVNGNLVSFVPGTGAPAGDTNYPTAPTTLKTNTAYKLVMIQGDTEKVDVFNGKMSGSYLDTTTNSAEYVDVYVEEVSGGYRFYFMDGTTKKYIELYVNSSNKARPEITTSPDAVWTYNAEAKQYTITLTAGKFTDPYYLGTYGTYDTIGCSSTYYITGDNAANYGVSQFAAILMEEVPTWDFGGTTPEPEPDPEPDPNVNYGPLAENTAYVMYMEQNDPAVNKTLYFSGAMSGSYLATTETEADATKVYMEKVTGGVRFYFMDGTTKKYVQMYVNSSDKVRPEITTSPNVVWTYDEEVDLYVITLTAGNFTDPYYLGTYGTYDTISASSTYYITGSNAAKKGVSQFYVEFKAATGGETGGDEGGDEDPFVKPTTPEAIVNAAYALGKGETLEGGSYTLTGVLTQVGQFNTQYGDVTVVMVVNGMTDKPIECYALKGTGNDSLAVGDTITVTGTIKNYNGKVEFDKPNLDAVVKGEGGSGNQGGGTSSVPTDPKEIVDAAFALQSGESMSAPVTLTGKITLIDKAYDAGFGNISVVISVEGTTGTQSLLCYRLTGDDQTAVANLAVTDTITVTGTIKNYNGTIEFDAGCNLDAVVKGEGPVVSNDTYTKIDKVANLSAGTYYMAAYQTAGTSADFSANPYHLWIGTVSGGKLSTSAYAFSGSKLTVGASAAEITLVAVAGKTNVYNIMVGSKYLTVGTAKNTLSLTNTAVEWTASNNENGGITWACNGMYMGSAKADSALIRNYDAESKLASGVVFFAKNA